NAAKAGIEQNDIIVKIDDKEIKGTDDVTSTMRANKDKNSYAFSILRDGKKMILDVKVPRKLKTADL
ncbi:MAG TPA: PDZ domain-containing protein, partial [Flavisolibacter sp.]|nr:PDZ domain-containing protein [Flavisolibacter sp.]